VYKGIKMEVLKVTHRKKKASLFLTPGACLYEGKSALFLMLKACSRMVRAI
jgi:hypothetical protein